MFSNYTSCKISFLRNLSMIFNLSLMRVKPFLIGSGVKTFSKLNNIFYIGSMNLNYFLKFLSNNLLKEHPTLKIINFRWGLNFLTNKFFSNKLKALLTLISANLKIDIIKNINIRFFTVVKVIWLELTRLLKIFKYLKYSYANSSPTATGS